MKGIGIRQAMGLPRRDVHAAKPQAGKEWPSSYLELIRQAPALAATAKDLATKHGYTLSSVCDVILTLREEGMQAGERKERERVQTDLDAAKFAGMSLSQYLGFADGPGMSEAEIDIAAADFAGMSLAEYRKWSKEAKNAESR